MPLLRRIFALALLALWLPATLHCALEAAGLGEVFHCAVDHHAGSGHDTPADASRDACDIIEGSAFKLSSGLTLLPPPALAASLLVSVTPPDSLALSPPPGGVSDRIEPPPEVARTWHFLARAALPARAPSPLS